MKGTIWHNPRCSKSRATLAILKEAGADVTVVDYLATPPTAADTSLLERPLVETARGVVLARPPERIHDIL